MSQIFVYVYVDKTLEEESRTIFANRYKTLLTIAVIKIGRGIIIKQ